MSRDGAIEDGRNPGVQAASCFSGRTARTSVPEGERPASP
jgi:hypothetical protein